jgi:hypothetical protein
MILMVAVELPTFSHRNLANGVQEEENLKGKHHLEDLDVDGRIILDCGP